MNPDESFMAGIPAEEIRQHFSLAAARAGLLRPGEPIDQTQIDFATEIVTILEASRTVPPLAMSA